MKMEIKVQMKMKLEMEIYIGGDEYGGLEDKDEG